MKLKIILFVLILIATILADTNLFSQCYWSYTSPHIYTTDRVDIGTYAGDTDKRLNVYSSETYGWESGNYNLVDFTSSQYSFKGKLWARVADGSSYTANGSGFGISAYVTDVTKLKNSLSNKTSYAAGGNFGVAIDDPIPDYYKSIGSYIIAGARAFIAGNITTYPANGVVAGLFVQDFIQGAHTWAGYFDGNLAVTDTITTSNIQVISSVPWPDYVFDEDYEFTEIDQLESFVKTNKHLPGMPSAKAVREEGIDLEEMSVLLMEKVEELSLYVIELNKEIEKLKADK